jgi:hypothetical protein
MSQFSHSEWNTLMSQARAALREGARCAPRDGGASTACSQRFRAVQRRLAALAEAAPARHKYQLRRTLDALELDYRWMGKEEGGE